MFTTTETIATQGALTITNNRGDDEPFSIAKLLMSIAPLLTQQTTAPDDAYWLAMTAYEKALASGETVIKTSMLADLTFTTIERFDSTAALKYALDHHLTKLPASRAKRPRI